MHIEEAICRMLAENQHALLAEVASMYYEQDMTQNAIAEELGLSRVKVYRLLKQAKEFGVVQIMIDWPTRRHTGLEEALRLSFGLQDALVLRASHQDNRFPLSFLAKLAAAQLETLLKNSAAMAICVGQSTYEVIRAIRSDYQAHVQVVQAVGSVPSAMREFDSSALARQLAEKLGGEVLYLASPPMADTTDAARIIRNQREIQRALKTARAADVALIGIGNLNPLTSGLVKAGFISADELSLLAEQGAVGDIAWQIYTIDGELYPCEFNERVIGITLEDLRKIPNTVAVAMGLEKSRAILGGLRTGVIDIFCTDDQTARELLRLNKLDDTVSGIDRL